MHGARATPLHQSTNAPKHQSTWRTPWQGPGAATRLLLTYNRVARQAADLAKEYDKKAASLELTPDLAKKYDKKAAALELTKAREKWRTAATLEFTKALQEVCRLAPPSPFILNPAP